MPTKTMLLTRPDHDRVVHYLSSWANLVKSEARKQGFKVIDLNKDRANPTEFLKVLTRRNPRFLVLNGHGSHSTITGHNDEPLLDSNNLAEGISSKILFALSCKAAKELGKACIQNGSDAFIGYDENFVFISDANSVSRPEKDVIAKPFKKSAIKPAISLLKGHTAKEAFDSSQTEYDKWIADYWEKRSKDTTAPHVLKALLWDKMNQRCLGNPQTKIM